MKQIEGITEENGSVFYEYNGGKINLTAIGDECGAFHMTKAINTLMDKTGLVRKDATNIIYVAYKETPPNRAKLQKEREELENYKKVAKEIDEAKANEPVKCPKCGSTSLSADKKGFGIGKAVVGGAVAGPLGLMAGNIGAKKVRITCLNCGHQFWAGKR